MGMIFFNEHLPTLLISVQSSGITSEIIEMKFIC